MEKCNRLISHLAFPIDYRLFQLIVPPLIYLKKQAFHLNLVFLKTDRHYKEKI